MVGYLAQVASLMVADLRIDKWLGANSDQRLLVMRRSFRDHLPIVKIEVTC